MLFYDSFYGVVVERVGCWVKKIIKKKKFNFLNLVLHGLYLDCYPLKISLTVVPSSSLERT